MLDSLNRGALETVAEVCELWQIVKFGTVEKSSGPGENTSYGISRCLLTFLVLPIMSSNCSVSSLSLNSTVRGEQD